MPVNPWAGTNQGLASLNSTFDTIEAQRVKGLELDRQARIDALQEPILRAQGEKANLEVEREREKMSDLRAYDAERKDMARNPGTVPTITEYTPPGSMTGLASIKERYRQPTTIPAQGATEMTYAGEGGPTSIPKESLSMLPEQRLPSQQIAGERLMTRNEQTKREVDLAIRHNQWDRVSNLVTVSNLMEKLDPSSAEKLSAWTEKIIKFAESGQFTPDQIKAFGDLYANKIDPSGELAKQVRQFEFRDGGMQKDIYSPDGAWLGKAVTDNKGTVHIVQPKDRSEKSLSEEQLVRGSLRESLKREPTFAEIRTEMQKGKMDVAREKKEIIGGDDLQGMTPEDIKHYARMYNLTGQLPPLGMGKSPLRAAILKEASAEARNQGQDAAGIQAQINDMKASQNALKQNEQRQTAINTYVNRIDANIPIIKELKKKYGTNFGPVLNRAANLIQSNTAGSGDVESLRLAILATAAEVAKVESGQIGAQGADVATLKEYRQSFDLRHNEADLFKMLDTAERLGKTSRKAVSDESDRLREKMKAMGKKGGTGPGVQDLVDRKGAPSGATHSATRDANGNWTITPVGGR